MSEFDNRDDRHDASHDAFAREALRWLDDVARFARSLTHDESDAGDVVQETYLRAFRSWQTFEPGTDCRRWLFTICRNVFLRTLERERPTIDLDDPEMETLAAVRLHAVAREGGYDDLFTRLDVGPAVERALALLPEVYRAAVVLVDVEGESYEGAAAVLGVPMGTVRSRLFRGRRMMQESLVEYARDAGLAKGWLHVVLKR